MDKEGADWHRANPMPKNPTLDQRIAWHVGHARHCACRPVPPRLAAEMGRRGISIPPLDAQPRG